MCKGGNVTRLGSVIFSLCLLLILPGITLADGLGGGEFQPTQIQEIVRQGNQLRGTITWKNTGSVSEKFVITREDLAVDNQGNLIVVPFNSTQQSLGETLSYTPETKTLQAGETLSIDYTVTIPDDYTVGDHFLALVLSLSSNAFPAHKIAIPFVIRVTPKPVVSTNPETGETSTNDDTTDTGAEQGTIGAVMPNNIPRETEATNPSASESPSKEAGPSAAPDASPVPSSSPVASLTKLHTIPQPMATAAPKSTVSYPVLTQLTDAWRLENLRGPTIAIWRPTFQLDFTNIGNTLISPTSSVEYYDRTGSLIDSSEVTARQLLPGTTRQVVTPLPNLAVKTPIGHLPFIGMLHLTATDERDATVASDMYVMPWWVLTLGLLALVAFITRLLSFHPRAPHRHLVFRYQGRASFTIILVILGIAALTAQGVLTPVTFAAGLPGRARSSVKVISVTGYKMRETPTAIVIDVRTNRLITFIVDRVVYVMRPGAGPLNLPKGKEILIISPLTVTSL